LCCSVQASLLCNDAFLGELKELAAPAKAAA
jgi:hypothetical protein